MSFSVCIIGSMAPYHSAGPGVYVDNLSRELAKHIEVHVITWGPENKEYTDRYGRKIHLIKARRFRTLRAVLKARKIRNEFDILHVNQVISANLAHFLIKKPLVLTVHGYSTYEAVSRGKIRENSISFRLMMRAEKKAMERADAVIAVGKTLRKWIVGNLGVEPEKVFYVPNGIDSNIFKPIYFDENSRKNIKKKYGLPEDAMILLFTKHFTPRYGITYILKSLKKIQRKNKKIYLVATNEDDYLPKIKNIAKDLGIYNRCIFTGSVSLRTLVELYNIADVFLHTSINNQETFGISLIEAMACELPVISTAVGGPKEILEEGKRQMGEDVGIMIPQKDSKAIAEKIIYLLEHPDEAKEMGKKAREFVLKNYTWDISVKKVLKVYNLLD